jgi:hypothetical protein
MGGSDGAKFAPDSAGINADNVIGVEMEDLPEKDGKDLELEL